MFVVTPEHFRAKGDGATDDSAALQAAHDACLPAGGVVTLRPGTRYNLGSTTINWQANKVSLRGNGAILSWPSLTGANAGIHMEQQDATVNGVSVSNKGHFVRSFADVQLRGPGSAAGYGILADTNTAQYSTRAVMRNVVFREFLAGFVSADRGYLHIFDQCEWFSNGTGYLVLSGSDAGENIRFANCLFGDNTVCISNAGASDESLDLSIFGTSFDYNSAVFNLTQGGRVHVFGGHIESDPAECGNGWLIECADGKFTNFVMVGGVVLLSGTGPHASHSHAIIGGTRATIKFDSVYLQNLRTTTDLFCNGAAKLVLDNNWLPSMGTQAPRIAGDNVKNQIVADGGFENSSLNRDLLYAEGATANRLTGTNTTLASDNANQRTGTRCMSIAKSTSAATTSAVNIMIPANRGGRLVGTMWVKASTPITNFAVEVRAQILTPGGSNVVPTVGQSTTIGATANVSVGTSYQEVPFSSYDDTIIPAWATHINIRIEMYNVAASTVYVDDLSAMIW